MKNLLITLITVVLLVGFNACSKFDELNTDPNNTNKVTAELLATNLILQPVSYSHVGNEFLYKDMLSKYISYMEGVNSYQYNKIERTYFSSLVNLTNVQKMIDAATGSIYEDSYRALGHFLRAYTFFDLTMHVGDIPYSEALKGESGIYNPKYDTQRDVFLGILDELEQASTFFATGRNFAGDMIYDGNVQKWQKAVNSFELKVLTHLMKKTDDADLKVIERFNAIVTGKPILASNGDNFQLVYSDAEVEFYPFYNSNFKNYPIMSTTIIDKMKEMQDYRLFYFANPSNAQISAGHTPDDWEAYVGVNPSDDFSSIAARYNAGQISGINSRYYKLSKGEPSFFISYAEQCFIIAEGILRGWTGGDAQSYYEKGVQAAMLFVASNTPDDAQYHHDRKITSDIINAYIASAPVAFTGSTEDKLNKIFQQRYFIGFLQDGWNTYFEYRRVGYPQLPINEQTNLNSIPSKIPVRWLYPSNELSYNRQNVEEAISRQFNGDDNVNELMWILK